MLIVRIEPMPVPPLVKVDGVAYVRRGIDYSIGYATQFITDSVTNLGSLSYVGPYAAYVSDNTLFGYTGAISGRRCCRRRRSNPG